MTKLTSHLMPREGWRENYRCVTHVWLTKVVLPSNRSDFEVTSIRFGNHTTLCHFEVSKWVEVSLWWHQKLIKNRQKWKVRHTGGAVRVYPIAYIKGASPRRAFAVPRPLLPLFLFLCQTQVSCHIIQMFTKYMVPFSISYDFFYYI